MVQLYVWGGFLDNVQLVCFFNAVVDRYMRNDLTRLQIRCVNAARGCEVVCSLENLNAHEDECEFAFVSCSNTGKNTLPFCNHLMTRLCFDCNVTRHCWVCVEMQGGIYGDSHIPETEHTSSSFHYALMSI